jgi:hypothetical protein
MAVDRRRIEDCIFRYIRFVRASCWFLIIEAYYVARNCIILEYSDWVFLSPSKQMAVYYPKLGCGQLLSHPSRFIVL